MTFAFDLILCLMILGTAAIAQEAATRPGAAARAKGLMVMSLLHEIRRPRLARRKGRHRPRRPDATRASPAPCGAVLSEPLPWRRNWLAPSIAHVCSIDIA